MKRFRFASVTQAQEAVSSKTMPLNMAAPACRGVPYVRLAHADVKPFQRVGFIEATLYSLDWWELGI